MYYVSIVHTTLQRVIMFTVYLKAQDAMSPLQLTTWDIQTSQQVQTDNIKTDHIQTDRQYGKGIETDMDLHR